MTARRSDRGSVSVELVILAPLFGLLLLGVIAVGRVSNARADVDAAARMAARDLSIARDPQSRLADVERTVAETLDVGSPSCRSMSMNASIADDSIEVTVNRISGNRVTLGISAPDHVHIVRAEIEPVVNAFRKESMTTAARQPAPVVSLDTPMVCAAPLVS